MTAVNMQREQDRLKQRNLTELLDKREAILFDLKQNKQDLKLLGHPASFFNDLMTSGEWANYMEEKGHTLLPKSDLESYKRAGKNISAINEKLEKENASLMKIVKKLRTKKKTGKKK